MNSQHFPAGLRDPLKHFTGMHKGIDADLIVSLDPPVHSLLSIPCRSASCHRLVLPLVLAPRLRLHPTGDSADISPHTSYPTSPPSFSTNRSPT